MQEPSKQLLSHKHSRWNEAIVITITRRIEAEVVAAVRANRALPIGIDIPGIAQVGLSNDSLGTQEITGPQISAAELRKILTNGVFPAANQLAAGVPGVIVVESEYPALHWHAKCSIRQSISNSLG